MTVASKRKRKRPEPRDEARVRIIDAAKAEFAARGYEGASTNAIADAAGVAKGLVFHYFESKPELYLAVVEQLSDRLMESFLDASRAWPADLFERLYAMSMHKVRVFQRDPQGYAVMATLLDAPPAVRERILEKSRELRERVWPVLLRDVDTSKLRPGLSLADAVDTVGVLQQGLERQIVARIQSLPDRGQSQMEQIVRDVWKYFERLRDGLYAS